MLLEDVFSRGRGLAPGRAVFRRQGLATRQQGVATRQSPAARPPAAETFGPPERQRPESIRQDILCLLPTRPLDRNVADILVNAVVRTVTSSAPVPKIVVLALEATAETDAEACGALIELYDQLRACGQRMYLGALQPSVFERLRECGVVGRLGMDGVRQSLQTAMLSAYEELAGPAVVTRGVVAELAQQVTPLAL